MAKPSQPPPTVTPEVVTQAPLIFAAPKTENRMIMFSGLHRAVRVFAAHARPWGEPADVIRETVEHCNALGVEIDLHFRDDLIAVRPGDCYIQLAEAFESRAAARAKPVARSTRTAHPAASAIHHDEPKSSLRTTIVLSNGHRHFDNTEAAIPRLSHARYMIGDPMRTDSVHLSPDDIRQLRTVAEAVARRDSSASRFAIEIAERFNLRTGERALNILAISDDPDWADTDLNTTLPWSQIRERQPLVRGRALFDLYIYERPGIGETGDLVCCVQVEIDRTGLAAIHADSAKNIWCREGPLPKLPSSTAP